MRENVGRKDRILRSILGPILMGIGVVELALAERRALGGVALVAGALVLESAITRVCPVSAALGLDTRTNAERMRDFRGDVDEQTARIRHDYGKPVASA